MLTFGGHKGSALAAMIELLAGPLIGDLTSAQSLAHDAGAGASPFHGELILAFDPRRFLGERYEHTCTARKPCSTASSSRVPACLPPGATRRVGAAWRRASRSTMNCWTN